VSEISYESIAPLISHESQEGRTLNVVFTCPATGEAVEASASLREGSGLGATAKRSAIQNVLWNLSYSIRRMFGYSIAGRVAGDVAQSATSSAGDKARFGKAEKEAAAVDAFQRVASQFSWDEAQARWVHQSAVAPA
jgi:hypothetical protein